MRTVICLPTYNERENLPSLVEEILGTVDVDLMILDDNSPDGTGAAADFLAERDPRVKPVHRPERRGIAKAYEDAFERALAEGYEQILQMDADFSHQPRYLPAMLAALREADMVVGSRYADGGNVEKWGVGRRLLSRTANLYASTLLGLPCRDATAGFVGYKRHVLEAVDFRSVFAESEAFQVELKYRAHRLGFTIAEVPILYWDRVVGSSKLSSDAAMGSALRLLHLRIRDVR